MAYTKGLLKYILRKKGENYYQYMQRIKKESNEALFNPDMNVPEKEKRKFVNRRKF